MSDRVRELLRDARVPGEADAEHRSRQVIGAAYDESDPRPRPRRSVGRLALVVGVCLAVGVVAVTPPGPAVARWIKRAFEGDGVPHAQHALSRLPASGRVLTAGADGAAIVNADGSRRFLGPYREASWSPQGLFVVVVRGRQLVAVDPVGRVRWAITPPHRPTQPRWSPDGFRIAYRSGGALRVVAGDGTGDRLLAARARAGTAAWRPGSPHTLAWGDRHGRLVVADVDRGVLVRTALGGIRVPVATRALAWSGDGVRVYVLTPRDVRVWNVRTSRVRRTPLPADRVGVDLAAAPDGRRVAMVERDATRTRSEIVLLPGTWTHLAGRRLFGATGLLTSIEWSPDSKWVLATWREADQWVFVRATGPPQIRAVADVARQLDPAARGRASFPRVEGWCCGS